MLPLAGVTDAAESGRQILFSLRFCDAAMRRLATRPFLMVLVLVAPALAGCLEFPLDGAPGVLPATGEGLVVASHPLAAAAGVEALAAGGNAVDAAAAVQFVLAVVEPHFSGLGGGAFLLLRNGTSGEALVLDGREVAPAASTADQFLGPTGEPRSWSEAHTRGYAIGVPGTVRVWAEAVERYGQLPLARAIEPAIRYAEDGFPVDAYLAEYLTVPAYEEKLKSWPPSARIFYKGAICPPAVAGLEAPTGCAGGEPYREGEILRQPDLAATLRLLAREGPREFYEGEVAQAVVDAVRQREGRMTTEDLADYEVVEREPLRGTYRGLDVLTMPAPGGGPVVLQILGLLEGFDLQTSGHNTADTLHLLIEAMHLAYADRAAYLGDPDHARIPTGGLLHPDYLDERRALIGPRANPNVEAGDPWRYDDGTPSHAAGHLNPHDEMHTSHLVVRDADGLIVSATTTIENYFGSGMVVPGYGFLLNNELTDFDFRPGGPNEVEPGKRPRSSMSPAILLQDGEPMMIVGASGGATIITSIAQVIQNVMDHDLPLRDAVDSARIWSPTYPHVAWDRDLPASIREGLRERGHEPAAEPRRHISQVEAALLTPHGWVGAADARAAAGGVATG